MQDIYGLSKVSLVLGPLKSILLAAFDRLILGAAAGPGSSMQLFTYHAFVATEPAHYTQGIMLQTANSDHCESSSPASYFDQEALISLRSCRPAWSSKNTCVVAIAFNVASSTGIHGSCASLVRGRQAQGFVHRRRKD